jgi:hypothetical protein
MLRACPSGLTALIFVNTTPFPMTYGSGLYRYIMGQRTQMLLLCQCFRRHFTGLRLFAASREEALCPVQQGEGPVHPLMMQERR